MLTLKKMTISPAMQKELITNYKAVFFAIFAQIINQASEAGEDCSERIFDNLTTADFLIDKMPVNALQFVKKVIAYCLPLDSFSRADRQLALKKIKKTYALCYFLCLKS